MQHFSDCGRGDPADFLAAEPVVAQSGKNGRAGDDSDVEFTSVELECQRMAQIDGNGDIEPRVALCEIAQQFRDDLMASAGSSTP